MNVLDRAKGAAWGLMGPTGVGKSELALEVARAHGCHILNCDSVQVYAGFDLGSAKPTPAERAEVPHHLYDVAPVPTQAAAQGGEGGGYDAGLWRAAAEDTLQRLYALGQQALLCGGTGLYLRVLRQGLLAVGKDEALRAALLAREAAAPGSVFAELKQVDADSAAAIGPYNVLRQVRALEVTRLCGAPASLVRSAHQASRAAAEGATAVRLIVLDAPREWLKPRLVARAERMVAGGLLEEIEGLLRADVSPLSSPMRSVGYREGAAVLGGTLAASELVATIAHRSWQYARRQRTWLRKEPNVAWLDAPTLLAQPRSERVDRLVALWQGGPE